MRRKFAIVLRILLYLFIILLMANVNALTDAVLNPGISYFNMTHLIVGGMMALLSTIICVKLEGNFSRSGRPGASARLAPLIWFMAISWTVIIFSSLAGDIIGKKGTNLEIALQEARTVYTKDLNYYRWATGHKGVFVPVTETTKPNPYLSHIPEYKLETTSGLKLTLVNPEYMIRQVYEMQTTAHEVLGHITSLDPIRAENAADPWEKKALEEFEGGVREFSSIEMIGGKPYLRLMRPMITEEGCLKCHALQGYDVGDIRGGISVSVPMTHLNELAAKDMATYTLGHVGLWLLGLLGIFLGSSRIHLAITEREEAEAKTRSIIDNMFDGLIITEDDGLIESLNSTAISMFEYQPKELQGRHISLLVPELHGGLAAGEAVKFKITPGRHHEVEGRRKDGDAFPLEMSISKMRFGAKMFFIAIVRDITEEKIRKAESLRAGKLAAIGELAAGVAHEINNPINGMINYAQILQDELSVDGNTEQSDILKRIIKEGDRVAVIVRNLLAFARQRDEDVGDISLKVILADCISLVKHQLSKEGIMPAIEVPDDLPSLRGNPQQLQQVFLNILSNARYALNQKFPGLDPQKRIEIKSQVVNFGDSNIIIRTTVTDYGCGISPKAIDHVFDSMFSTKPAGEGTGLGLSISRDLVQAHHGFIHVESRLDDHTTVTIDLPVQK
ncbi:MAG: DUF3365 domain-containing protein [Desulfobulbaceae bacterium]|nr:DUF3365 domain-containing protein [Desulfobulbaceae bacterium]